MYSEQCVKVIGDRQVFFVVVIFFLSWKKSHHPDSSLTTEIRHSKNEAGTLKCYWASFKNAR